MSILTFLHIAIFQGLVIGFILLRSPFFKSKTNRYLAFAILSLSWSLLNLVLDETQAFVEYPTLKIVDILDSAVLFPVLILLFTIHQVNHPSKDSKNLKLLFIPLLISLINSILDKFINESAATGFAYFLYIFSSILGLINLLITLVFIPFVLTKTFQVIQFSKNQKERKWLSSLWLFEVIFLMSWLLALLLSLFIEQEISQVMNVIALFTTLLIHWVAYFGLYKFKLVNDQKKMKVLLLQNRTPLPITAIAKFTSTTKNKAAQQSISITKKVSLVSEDNAHYLKLVKLCSEQKIYQDSTLDRNKVAEMLGISPSYLSQLINSITGENFSTYINRYRVEAVKKLILDEEFDNYSLLSIGLECGFSSKTTYYNWFKKLTKMTPNAYRKIHQ